MPDAFAEQDLLPGTMTYCPPMRRGKIRSETGFILKEIKSAFFPCDFLSYP
jgi:hypothetical protein